ncbi:hypothetical protein Tco_0353546 [Tanacetum coccineum]
MMIPTGLNIESSKSVDATALKTAALALSAAKEVRISVGRLELSGKLDERIDPALQLQRELQSREVKRVQARKHCTKAEAAMPFTSEKMRNS